MDANLQHEPAAAEVVAKLVVGHAQKRRPSDAGRASPRIVRHGYAQDVLLCASCGQENPDGFRFCGHSQIVDFMGKTHAEADDAEETIIYADLDLAAADRNRVVRVPGKWEFDRIATRRPEMYKVITEARK